MRNFCIFLFTIMVMFLVMPVLAFAQEAAPAVDPFVAWLQSNAWFAYLMTAMLGVKAVTTMLPSSISNAPWYNVIMKGVNYFILNFGKNKNADDKPINS